MPILARDIFYFLNEKWLLLLPLRFLNKERERENESLVNSLFLETTSVTKAV